MAALHEAAAVARWQSMRRVLWRGAFVVMLGALLACNLQSNLLRPAHRPFEEAREYARSLGLQTTAEWNEWASSEERPRDIPLAPWLAYGRRWRGSCRDYRRCRARRC